MHGQHILTEDNLELLRGVVTRAVRDSVGSVDKPKHELIERLRTYERTAWAVGMEPQTLQVITSGRRLLGDTLDLWPETIRRQRERPISTRRRPR